MLIHTQSGSPEYISWKHMRQRCLNPNDKDSKHYLEKRISICSEWDNFENFINDLGPRPYDFVLDRKDLNGNYCKENCRWVDKFVSNYNKIVPRKSGLPRGVYKLRNHYEARININGRQYFLGCFHSIQEAKGAYNKVALEWYGFLVKENNNG